MKVICMIPARLGSQRLRQKNLRTINGVPLFALAVRKALAAGVFDEVWANTESDELGRLALSEGALFHKRPEKLADNAATSEDFVYEFLTHHQCDYVVQLHSIAPLLSAGEINGFTQFLAESGCDTLLSVEEIILECLFDGSPVNFTFDRKENSQDLKPVSKIAWSITGWKRETYIKAYESGGCGTYSGVVKSFPLQKYSAHVIKTEEDLMIAETLYSLHRGQT
ncbi:cytidyltransferase [Geovibrio thiophilus]|uniref:Cytidyltransferase n=1 Tax=Geovibrio thiophilus TaxID=139438 RepID=A0A410JVB6_9BACT|nr:cytidyltransferase [Geovibrio thiophilus]QAR32103.1 cytidyltransferase [Geovibrio thiophilus]